MTNISEQLKLSRKERGLTQAQLAEALNVSLSVIALIESGARQPSKEMSLKLSQFFNLPLEKFSANVVVVKSPIDPELLIDIMDAITEFLAENNLEMTREQRKELIKSFCDNGLNDPQRIKDVLFGMLAAGSDIFTKKVR